MLSEPIAVTLIVTDVLDALGVLYAIGGSLASAVHGVARATRDADIIADLRAAHVTPLVRSLEDAFYVDAEMIREAIQQRGNFNVIHWDTQFKVDVFIPKRRAFDRAQLDRRILQVVELDPDRTAFVTSAEDTILAKLDWYRMSNHVLSQQWRDVLEVIRVQGDRLDLDYTRSQATHLGVSDLLQRALVEAGLADFPAE